MKPYALAAVWFAGLIGPCWAPTLPALYSVNVEDRRSQAPDRCVPVDGAYRLIEWGPNVLLLPWWLELTGSR